MNLSLFIISFICLFSILLILLASLARDVRALLRAKRPRATRIVLQIKENGMPQTNTLKVGKTYQVVPQPVGDAGEPEQASGFAYNLSDTSVATLTPNQDGTAVLSVLKSGSAVLTVTAQNTDNQQINGEADLTLAGVATSINLQFNEQ